MKEILVTPQQAQYFLNKVMSDPKHPYHHPKHRQHNAAIKIMHAIMQHMKREQEMIRKRRRSK